MAFTKVAIEVSKRDPAKNNKFSKVGDVEIYVPTLAAVAGLVAGAEVKKDDKGAEIIEDGLPVYVSDEANWIQGAILAQVKAQARNKLVPQSATLKEGQKIAETWEELCAEGERGGGAGLVIAREFKASFANWVKTLGLAENAANVLITLVSNRPALEVQPDGVKEKVNARLEAYVNTLDEVTLEKFTRPLEALAEAAKPGVATDF